MDEFLDAGYRLSQENDEFEQPENEEILAGNFLLGIMGVGAKERVRRKLETEKFIGDTTIGQINRIAAQRDFVDVFGGEFSRAALDPTIGPRILDSNEVADVKNDTNIELVKKTTGNTGKDNLTAFLVDKLGEADVSKDATAIFLAMNDPTKEATELTETQRGYLKEFKEKMLYDAFIEESAGMNLKPSEVGFFGSEIENIYKKYSEKDKDDSTTGKKAALGDQVEKVLSEKEQKKKYNELVADGTLKPGDEYIFTKKDGTKFKKIVPSKVSVDNKIDKISKTQEAKNKVKDREALTKEDFDALEDNVERLTMQDQFRWREQYGLTHFPDGKKVSYEEYVRNFEQDVIKDTTSLEKKEERLEKIRRHKEKFKTGIAGP
jgi:hypothetical protein